MNSSGALFPVPAVADNLSIAAQQVPTSQRLQQSNGPSSSNTGLGNDFVTLHVTNQDASIVIDHHRHQEGFCGKKRMSDEGKNAIIPSPTKLKRQSAVFVDPQKLLTESTESYAQELVFLAVEGEDNGSYPWNFSAVALMPGHDFRTTHHTTPLPVRPIPLKCSCPTDSAVAPHGSLSSSTEFDEYSVLTDDGVGSRVALKEKTSGSSMKAMPPFTLPWNTDSSGLEIPSEIAVPGGRHSAPPFAVKDKTAMNSVYNEERVSFTAAAGPFLGLVHPIPMTATDKTEDTPSIMMGSPCGILVSPQDSLAQLPSILMKSRYGTSSCSLEPTDLGKMSIFPPRVTKKIYPDLYRFGFPQLQKTSTKAPRRSTIACCGAQAVEYPPSDTVPRDKARRRNSIAFGVPTKNNLLDDSDVRPSAFSPYSTERDAGIHRAEF